VGSKATKQLQIRPDLQNDASVDLRKDFLPLNSSGSRKRRRIDDGAPTREHSSSDESPPDYRLIVGKAKARHHTSPDLEAISDSNLDSEEERARQRNVVLSRRVAGHPDDVDSWLDLIDHQDAMVGTADGEGVRILTSAESRSVADIKVSMYEKALNKVGSCVPRDRLLLGMMEEGSKIWDTKSLSKKWKSILQAYPNYLTLWVKYLDFQQTQFVNFTYEQCRSVFMECLKMTGARLDTGERITITVYILLRLSLFMREAGFSEHAIGLWQAILEFNFFKPVDITKDHDAATSSFAQFWESEAPRIGEVDAKGWAHADSVGMDARSDTTNLPIDNDSVFESWDKCERHRALHSRLPARTLDEVPEDDPYRVILFSDIKDFLIPFSEHGASDLLIDSFLLFCHLPPLGLHRNGETVQQWRGDQFICNALLDQLNGNSAVWFSDLRGDSEKTAQLAPVVFPHHQFAVSLDTLFGNSSWFSALEAWKSTSMRNDGAVDSDWVLRILRHLVDRFQDNNDLAEYTLALECVGRPKEASKYAKALLKKHPSNPRLYNAYALIEHRDGHANMAERVWTTTLSMSQKFAEKDRADCILLWRTWVWETIGSQNFSKAVQIILAIPDSNIDSVASASVAHTKLTISPTEFLKTQRVGALRHILEHC
jgi:hypothetical protein